MPVGGSIIGALRFVFGADTAQLEVATQRASKSMRGAARAGEVAGAVVARTITQLAGLAAAFVGVSAVIQRFNRAIEDVDALAQLSKQSGISTEALSELRFAASSVGLTFQQLDQSIRGFSQRMAEGLGNPTSATTLALEALGVSARDAAGNLLNFDQILPALADGFARYADGAAKAQLASALFGEEAGPRLLTLLGQGRQGIEALREEARRLGVVVDGEAVRSAQQYKAEIEKLNSAFDSLARELTIAAVPAVTAFTNAMASALAAIRSAAQGPSIADQITQQEAAIERLTGIVARLTEGSAMWRVRTDELAAAHARLNALLDEQWRIGTRVAPTDDRPPAPDIAAMRLAQQEALNQARSELQLFQEQVFGERTLIETINMEWLNHADIIAEAQVRIQEAYQNSGDARRALADINRKMALQEQAAMLQTAQMFGQTLTALWPKSKAAAIAEAVINTGVAITKALTSGIPPWNIAQAALVAAQGLAQINAIKSTNLSGGGSVPSVGGGSSSAPIAPAPQGPQTAVQINLPGGEFFSSEQVARLMENLNEHTKNGHVLIATRVA